MRVALALHALDQVLVQPFHELLEGGWKLIGRATFVRCVEVERPAPDLVAGALLEGKKRVKETREQIALGQQQVNGQPDADGRANLVKARAQCGCMLCALYRVEHQQIGDRDGDQRAVQRLPRPPALQQGEEALPRPAVGHAIGLVRRVAPSRVQQHRSVGEPPVAISRAANALDGAAPEFAGERKVQAGVQQRRGLPGAWGTDDQVPGQLVQILAPEFPRQGRPESAARAEPGASQRGQGGRESLAQLRQLGRLCAARRGRELVDHALVAASGAPGGPALVYEILKRERRDQRDARIVARQRSRIADRCQRSGEPHQQPEGGQAQHSEQPGVDSHRPTSRTISMRPLCTGG